MSARTARKWVRRYRAEEEAGLLDRSSAPKHVHNSTPPERVEAVTALRRLRMTGPEIAELLEMATSTASAVRSGSAWASWAACCHQSRPAATSARGLMS